jgi:DNA repair exonuclease SbcCD nuclease subunit
VQVKRGGTLLACIQGISYPKRDERRNLSRLFKRTDPAFHIGLLHANVGSDTGHEPYAPCSMEDLLKPEMDYWALGHVHRQKVLSQHRPSIVYPGNTQARNIGETGERGCYLVRVGGHREVDIEFLATDVIRWTTRELSIHDLQTEQDLVNALDKTCLDISKTESGRPVIARIFLTGSGPLYGFLKKPNSVPDLLDILHETGMSCSPFVWIEQLRLRITPELDLDARMKEGDFLGELLRYSRELSEDSLFEDTRAGRFIDYPNRQELRDLLRKAEEICWENLHGEEDE